MRKAFLHIKETPYSNRGSSLLIYYKLNFCYIKRNVLKDKHTFNTFLSLIILLSKENYIFLILYFFLNFSA
ncbi:hypothetical protein HMPREF0973_02249 [Prevotella veroralis F0319]|uniref:Uncharacterized protein n=1 Tax=Prevotella veroralis F0319 TaxID=649761 RepID=C9MRJ2_9BACT|nr:hypothetical protein HMPREF0973_02249 [Prevotella veroralis F0319]